MSTMKRPSNIRERVTTGVVVIAALALATLLMKSGSGQSVDTNPRQQPVADSNGSAAEATVELAPSQLDAIKIGPIGMYPFPVEKEAVGSIDYDEDLSVQVFSPYQGKIIAALANLGDAVQKGQPLYTIDSPDLVQAESTLIAAVATFNLTNKEFLRASELYKNNGIPQRELEQATSDEQTAEGALKAARDAVRVFGKTEAEIDSIVATRKIDPVLVVISPINSRVTARNAQPGLLVQPGNVPAPYSVADLSTKWMIANVNESDCPLIQVGQPVKAEVMAYPGRVFEGTVSRLGSDVDPNTHTVMVRCDMVDPKDELRPGMLASFVIQVQAPVRSVAIPMNGVVRNGDGTLAAWVTSDRQHFVQRIVTVGLQNDGQYQVLDGLHQGELAVTDGAVFLSNILYAPPSD
jgi:membrane fusion protein, heavy metal efflux system